jgi:hypothetical protein
LDFTMCVLGFNEAMNILLICISFFDYAFSSMYLSSEHWYICIAPPKVIASSACYATQDRSRQHHQAKYSGADWNLLSSSFRSDMLLWLSYSISDSSYWPVVCANKPESSCFEFSLKGNKSQDKVFIWSKRKVLPKVKKMLRRFRNGIHWIHRSVTFFDPSCFQNVLSQ